MKKWEFMVERQHFLNFLLLVVFYITFQFKTLKCLKVWSMLSLVWILGCVNSMVSLFVLITHLILGEQAVYIVIMHLVYV